jgi:predicted DNA-binding helix-hairpin-helix protein
MFYNGYMETYEKLKLLTSQMHLEPAEDTSCIQLSPRRQDKISVSDAVLPNGKRISLLKSQLSTVCERNCYYCPFRAGRDFQRATFSTDEFAKVFMSLYQAHIAEGIFLSSGIVKNGTFTQDKLIDTAEILRNKLHFKGYIHLKIMPGAEYAQVERAMQLADRVSINLEAPTSDRLAKLAPKKQFIEELVQPLKWVNQIRQNQPYYKGWNNHWPSSVTQFVVSAIGETDLELLSTTEYLYNQLRLKRAYYSSFNPISDTPLENVPPGSPEREHRLYEASFLLRDYGFNLEDLPFDINGHLPLDVDPKLAWARENLSVKPIEINHVGRQDLLHVPGIGPKSAKAILDARIKNRLKYPEQLYALGVNLKRAAPYILINGKQAAYQTSFL